MLPASIFRHLCLYNCKQTNNRLSWWQSCMLYYDRIDKSEGIDPTKSNRSKECMICHWDFLISNSNFNILYTMVVVIWQYLPCLDISDIAIITGKNVDYCCIIHSSS